MSKYEKVTGDEVVMTKSQRRVVEALRRDVILEDGLGPDHAGDYEYKSFEVSQFSRRSDGLRLRRGWAQGRRGDTGAGLRPHPAVVGDRSARGRRTA